MTRRDNIGSVLFVLFLVMIAGVSHAQTEISIEIDPIGDDEPDMGCSLREAISVANAGLTEASGCESAQTGSGAPVFYNLNLPVMRYQLVGAADSGMSGGDLDIDSAINITGAGPEQTIIEGNGEDRVFHLVTSNAQVTLMQLEVSGGAAFDSPGGGGILIEQGVLNVEDVIIRNNRAVGVLGNSAADGGGIANQDGTLRIGPDAVLSDNGATGRGGAVFSSGILVVDGVTIQRNSSNSGGGISASGQATAIRNCVIEDNQADGTGGGVSVAGNALVAAAIENCSIVNNMASAGGGVFGTLLDIANSTVAANVATNAGGGLHLESSQLSHLTITKNTAENGGGGIFQSRPDIVVTNVLIAENDDVSGTSPDCSGSFVATGTNLIGRNDGCSVSFPGGAPNVNGDLVGTTILPVDPELSDLGGTPPVFLPARESIIIDRVDAGFCTYVARGGHGLFAQGDPVLVDQRGVFRDGLCDIGAIESVALFTDGFEEG